MEGALDVIRVVNLYVAGILAGGQAFCLVALVRALPEYEPEASQFVHQRSLRDHPHHFPRAVVGVALTGAALVVLLIVNEQWMPLVLTAVASTIAASSAAISSREWPINKEAKSWGSEPNLERYAELRRLWDSRHWLSTASLVLFAVAVAVGG